MGQLIATVTLALPFAVGSARAGRRAASAARARDTGDRTVHTHPHGRDQRADDRRGVRSVLRARRQTIVVTTIVLFQVVYLLALATWPNQWAIAGFFAVLALQAAFVYAPPLQGAFGSAPMSAADWLLAAAAAIVVLPVVDVDKRVRARSRSRSRS